MARRGRLTKRERWMLGAGLGVLAAVVVVLVISLGAAGPTSSRGCIYVTIPAPTGAQQIDRCGTAARATCESVATPGAFTRDAAQSVATECRKAGLPVG